MRIRLSYIGVAIVLAGACLYGLGVRLQNNFVVENQTGQPIRTARVEICDEIIDTGAIPAGGRSWQWFRISCDSDYRVLATLRDGTRVLGTDGSVTMGHTGLRDRIIITASHSVDVKQSGAWP